MRNTPRKMKNSSLLRAVQLAFCLAILILVVLPNSWADALPGPGPLPAPLPPPPPPPQPPPQTPLNAGIRGTGVGVAPNAGVLGARQGRGSFAVEVPAGYHGDTAQSRIVALQYALKTSLDALHQAPADPQGGFIESAIAALDQAQAETNQALDWLKAHPESDPLPAIPTRAGMPVLGIASGLGVRGRGNVGTAYPTVSTAALALGTALGNFIDGPYPGTSAVIGDLGGSRDQIMRSIGQAGANLNAGLSALARAMNPPGVRRGARGAPAAVNSANGQTSLPAPPTAVSAVPNPAVAGGSALVPPAPPPVPAPPAPSPAPTAPVVTIPFHFVVPVTSASDAKPGSISGTVADTDGLAANALITLQHLDNAQSLPPGGGRGPAGLAGNVSPALPVTITDETGAFTIKDLPPGFYSISATRSFGGGYGQSSARMNIEVKEGADTALPAPILFR